MKILMVSMNSLHFRRWTQQLSDSGHEVYWFDILDQGFVPSMAWVHQITGWKKGFLRLRGRTALKKTWPWFYHKLSKKFDVPVDIAFAKAVRDIRPDVVHSFVLYLSCTPILSVMQKNPEIKWVYSAWGSDLYYYQDIPKYRQDIKAVLPHINYLFTDCKRDHHLARTHGFKGVFLGVFPGGGGYDLKHLKRFAEPISLRKTILVKGNQNRSGRSLPVLQALEKIAAEIEDYEVVVYGAENPKVLHFRESGKLRFSIYGLISHEQVLKLMGRSIIHIGCSNSDGMPNALLEAMIMGAFPIQTNPGGATAEIIENMKNGLLLEDWSNVGAIAHKICSALKNSCLLQGAYQFNQNVIRPELAYDLIERKVKMAYNRINTPFVD